MVLNMSVCENKNENKNRNKNRNRYIYMSYMLHIYTLFFLLWQPSSNCNVSSFQKVHGVWTGGLLQVSTKTTIKTSENTRKSSDFQGKLDLKWEGSMKKHKASIDGKFDAFKTRSMCRNFPGTTIKTDANHGIQVHTAPPSPSPITSNIPVPTRKNRHATFQSMLQFFQHWLWALMTWLYIEEQGMLKVHQSFWWGVLSRRDTVVPWWCFHGHFFNNMSRVQSSLTRPVLKNPQNPRLQCMAIFINYNTFSAIKSQRFLLENPWKNGRFFFFENPSTKLQPGEMLMVEIVFWGKAFARTEIEL